MACGILVPWPGIEPSPLKQQFVVLTISSNLLMLDYFVYFYLFVFFLEVGGVAETPIYLGSSLTSLEQSKEVSERLNPRLKALVKSQIKHNCPILGCICFFTQHPYYYLQMTFYMINKFVYIYLPPQEYS